MFKKIAVAAALAMVSSVALADDQSSFYFGGDIGTTRFNQADDREGGTGTFAGYSFNQHVAVEAGYRRLVDSSALFDRENVEARTNQLALSVVGSVPFGKGFSAYGRLGYNRVKADVKELGKERYQQRTDGGLYGIGMAYTFRKLVSLRVELQKPTSDLTNLSVGVAFRF